MPNVDTTGPDGLGPTGLRRGVCGDAGGRGLGRRFARRERVVCPYVHGKNVISLEEEEKLLLERLEEVRNEIDEEKKLA